jgi:hypothetical protein
VPFLFLNWGDGEEENVRRKTRKQVVEEHHEKIKI